MFPFCSGRSPHLLSEYDGTLHCFLVQIILGYVHPLIHLKTSIIFDTLGLFGSWTFLPQYFKSVRIEKTHSTILF